MDWVFMCFVWIWEQTAIISLYNINWLVFITETECVYCAVQTEYLNVIPVTDDLIIPVYPIQLSVPPYRCIPSPFFVHQYFETVMVTYSKVRRLMNNLVTFTDYIRISFQCTEAHIVTNQFNAHTLQSFFRRCLSLCYSTYSLLFIEPEISLPFERILAAKNCNKGDCQYKFSGFQIFAFKRWSLLGPIYNFSEREILWSHFEISAYYESTWKDFLAQTDGNINYIVLILWNTTNCIQLQTAYSHLKKNSEWLKISVYLRYATVRYVDLVQNCIDARGHHFQLIL
jgi:hypothetical protein